jgi:CelD/BcsL family acetyltransferase involved in cellulose biosynthesis
MNVSLDGNFNKYLSTRSKGFRKNITRRFKKVQDAGLAIRIGRVTKSEEMRAAITRFGNMETMGWKGTIGTAVHSDNVQGHFYTDVMRNFAKRGKASIYGLYFDDILVAMQLCIASSNMLILLKTTYDESQSYFSPGRLLLYLLLEDQFAKKHVKTIEFYTNAKMNNLEWGTHARWINHHLLFRNKFLSSAYKEMKQLNDRLSFAW